MGKLGGLINGQNIAFDTHQAGDGQKVNWRDVHLEKRLHSNKGKARFPLLGNEKPSSSGMNDDDFQHVKKEVKKAFNKRKPLLRDLANMVVSELKRFSSGKATQEDAKQAAKKLAEYFDLNTDFLKIIKEYADADNELTSFATIHFNPATQTRHEIRQSKNEISIEEHDENKPSQKAKSRKKLKRAGLIK